MSAYLNICKHDTEPEIPQVTIFLQRQSDDPGAAEKRLSVRAESFPRRTKVFNLQRYPWM